MMTKILFRILLISFITGLVGCGSKLPALKPYKMEIQQGNVINSKMLMKLRPGMTKSQVRYVLGTPLILDSFHPNRWDYFYELRKQGKILNKRRVILDFQDNELVSVKGDVVPAKGDTVAEDDYVLKTPKSVAPPPQKETSWWDGLKFWGSDEEEVAKTVAGKKALSAEDMAVIEAAEQTSAVADTADALAQAADEVVEQASDAVEGGAAIAAAAAVEVVTPEVDDEVESVLRKEVDVAPSTEVLAAEVVEPVVAEPEVVKDEATIVADTVNAWANAWRSKNLDAYVANYVPTFKGKMRSRKGWLKQRDGRIAKRKGDISVEVEDLDVVIDGNKATAYFYQKYQSARYRDEVTKRLNFVKNKNTGEWLIWRETTIPKGKRPKVEKVSERPQVQEITAPENTEEHLEGMIEKIGF